MTASLNEKLRTVKWGKYKTSELFQPQKITNMLSKEDLSEKFNFPAYSSESTNNGIIGYTDSPEFICDDEHPVFVTFGDHTCSFNIATKSFSVLDNVKVLLPSIHNIRCLLWIITAWQKQIPNLGYVQTYFMRVGFVRHGIGTPEVPNCSTMPLVLLAGAVRSRTRL